MNYRQIELLNKHEIGIDFDELEYYLMCFKQAMNVSELSKYKDEYYELLNVLKEVRPDSLVFDSLTDIKRLKWDDFDIVRDRVTNKEIKGNNIIFIEDSLGIKVKATYFNGKYYRAFITSENNRYIDITELFRNKLNEDINCIEQFDEVELYFNVRISNCSNTIRGCIEAYRLLSQNIDGDFVIKLFDIRGAKSDRFTLMRQMKSEGVSIEDTAVAYGREGINEINKIKEKFENSSTIIVCTEAIEDGIVSRVNLEDSRGVFEVISINKIMENAKIKYLAKGKDRNKQCYIKIADIIEGNVKVGTIIESLGNGQYIIKKGSTQ